MRPKYHRTEVFTCFARKNQPKNVAEKEMVSEVGVSIISVNRLATLVGGGVPGSYMVIFVANSPVEVGS